MKRSIILGLGLVIICSFGGLTAQDTMALPAEQKQKLIDDLASAAKEARIEFNDQLVKAFTDSALSQKKVFTHIYDTIPKDVRAKRFARYLAAKSEAKTSLPPSSTTEIDLDDFNWGYLARDIQYSPMRLDSAKAAKLRIIESVGEKYIFDIKAKGIKPGNVVLLPVVSDQGRGYVTVTFDLADSKALWTGLPTGGQLKVVAAETSKGCEILVNSDPPEAAVYFNGEKWHEITNTSAVQDPGNWEVRLLRQGYKEWRNQRSLGPGETWTIDAVLVAQ